MRITEIIFSDRVLVAAALLQTAILLLSLLFVFHADGQRQKEFNIQLERQKFIVGHEIMARYYDQIEDLTQSELFSLDRSSLQEMEWTKEHRADFAKSIFITNLVWEAHQENLVREEKWISARQDLLNFVTSLPPQHKNNAARVTCDVAKFYTDGYQHYLKEIYSRGDFSSQEMEIFGDWESRCEA